MNKHKSKVNPTVEVTVCPGRVYLDYRTGNKRTELSSFVFDRVNGNWRMHIAPGNNKLVSGAFVAATLNQHGSYQRKTITRSEGVERVIFPKPVNLADYDIILVNSSAGKDSQAMLDHVAGEALKAGVYDRLVVVHADLGRVEWKGTRELAERQAAAYSVPFIVCRREDDLLNYVERRGQWPSNKTRYCTSDFKRAPIRKVMTALVAKHATPHKAVKILNCMGLRAQESPARAKKLPLTLNESASNGRREVWDYLPIHDWSTDKVWETITTSGVEHHPAYDLGMPRLSCVFCIFAPKSALMVAGRANPELLQEYVNVEQRINHTFRLDTSIASIQAAIARNETVSVVDTWNM